jgi:hypothetical protein
VCSSDLYQAVIRASRRLNICGGKPLSDEDKSRIIKSIHKIIYKPPAKSDNQAMLNIKEVAQRFNVDIKTVYKWIGDGQLPCVNISTNLSAKRPTYRISEKSLGDFISKRQG